MFIQPWLEANSDRWVSSCPFNGLLSEELGSKRCCFVSSTTGKHLARCHAAKAEDVVKSVFVLKRNYSQSFSHPLGSFYAPLILICCCIVELLYYTATSAFTHTLNYITHMSPPPPPPPHPPTQTRTASPAPPASALACQTGRRISWTASSRWSWPGRRPCPSGGPALCRPGWRLSWRCPCTSAPALKMSRVER